MITLINDFKLNLNIWGYLLYDCFIPVGTLMFKVEICMINAFKIMIMYPYIHMHGSYYFHNFSVKII